MRIKAVWFRMAVFHAAAKLVEVLTGEKPKSRRRRRRDKEQRIPQAYRRPQPATRSSGRHREAEAAGGNVVALRSAGQETEKLRVVNARSSGAAGI